MENNIDIDKLREGVFFAARGGAAKSCTAIGVIRALEEENIPIKGLSGESGSSLVVSLYSFGYNASEIKEIFLKYN